MAVKKVPAAKMIQGQEAQRTSARAWRARNSRGEEIELPSGNVALLRRPGPGMFLENGALPDSLTAIVSETVREKQGLQPESLAFLKDDPAMLAQMIGMINAAIVSAAIEPEVRADPLCTRLTPEEFSRLKDHVAVGGVIEGAEECAEPATEPIHHNPKLPNYHVFIPGEALPEDGREPDFLYASEVDLMDKMFIFQYAVGGTRDLERFRAEHGELVDGIYAVPDGPK